MHRDFKPDNVVIRPDGMPMLVDFGLLTRHGRELSRESPHAGGEVEGTVAYHGAGAAVSRARAIYDGSPEVRQPRVAARVSDLGRAIGALPTDP